MSARRKHHFEQELFEFAQEDGERRKGVDELLASVEEYARPARFLKLLAGIAHFRDYSPNNALMIVLQRPDARYVLTPRKWKSLGRFVKRGACPIIALRPFAPVMYLYDVSDTKVESGRRDGFDASWAEQSARDPEAEVPPEALQQLLDNLPLWGIAHGTFPAGPSLAVELRVGGDENEVLAIPVDGETVTCRQFEVQAVAGLVCRRLQVASPSCSFWADCEFERRDIPPISLDAVCDAVTEIERMLEPCTVRQGYLYRHSPSFAART